MKIGKCKLQKKVNNVSTDVTIFKVKGFDLSFDLLYCRGENGDVWVVAEKIESLSKHLHRAQRTRMSIENYKEKQYCRLWQEVKKMKTGVGPRKVYLCLNWENTVKILYVNLSQNLEQNLEL